MSAGLRFGKSGGDGGKVGHYIIVRDDSVSEGGSVNKFKMYFCVSVFKV